MGEAGAQLAMTGAELVRERERREQLQRERENDTARRLEVTAAVTLPPSPPHSPASILPVPPLGSKDRPLTLEELEEEIYASDSDAEEEGEVEGMLLFLWFVSRFVIVLTRRLRTNKFGGTIRRGYWSEEGA